MSIGVSMNWRNHEGRTSGLSFSRDTLADALQALLRDVEYYRSECGYREFQISIAKHCETCGGTGGKTVGKRVRRWKPCPMKCRHGIGELLAEFVWTAKTAELDKQPA